MKNEKGQTLLMAIFFMVILLFAVVFLFDLQNVVRAKLKGRNAIDAAALVGANWQRHSLNLIGDLNLVKASTVMLSDVVGTDHLLTIENANALLEKSSLMTQIQRRISFALPLVGVGAMQQAAKVNGLPANTNSSSVILEHINRVLCNAQYPSGYESPEFTTESIDRYFWRYDYCAMLDQLYSNGNGMAISVNGTYSNFNLPKASTPIGSFLLMKEVMESIIANDWCGVADLLDQDFSSDQWWGTFFKDPEANIFIGQSEYLPLFIETVYACEECKDQPCNHFPKKYNNPHLSSEALNQFLDDRNLIKIGSNEDNEDPLDLIHDKDPYYDPLRRLSFTCFDHNWRAYSQETVDMWHVFLRSNIRTENRFIGAHSAGYVKVNLVSKSTGMIPPPSIIPNAPQLTAPSEYDPETGEELPPLPSASSYIRPMEITAMAKPLGHLTGKTELLPPIAAGRLVLPCFDRSVLIPQSLEPLEGGCFDEEWYFFISEYLPALGECGSISDMGPDKLPYPEKWGMFLKYHNALLKLADPAWRTRGITWLTQPAVSDKDGNVIMTNRETCRKSTTPGGSGSTQGPPTLH